MQTGRFNETQLIGILIEYKPAMFTSALNRLQPKVGAPYEALTAVDAGSNLLSSYPIVRAHPLATTQPPCHPSPHDP